VRTALRGFFRSVQKARYGGRLTSWQFAAGPKEPAREQVEKYRVAEGFVRMAESGAEHTRFTELVGPRHGIAFAVLVAHGSGEGLRAGPDFLDHVEFVWGRGPLFREAFHDG